MFSYECAGIFFLFSHEYAMNLDRGEGPQSNVFNLSMLNHPLSNALLDNGNLGLVYAKLLQSGFLVAITTWQPSYKLHFNLT